MVVIVPWIAANAGIPHVGMSWNSQHIQLQQVSNIPYGTLWKHFLKKESLIRSTKNIRRERRKKKMLWDESTSSVMCSNHECQVSGTVPAYQNTSMYKVYIILHIIFCHLLPHCTPTVSTGIVLHLLTGIKWRD